MDGLPDYPVTKVLPELIQGLKTNNTIILVAPPGAGKTTLVPIELLDKVPGKICLIQPRRIAAKSAAKRISLLTNTKLGHAIGYQVRFESAISTTTKLYAATPGILTGKFLNDPFLSEIDTLIFDEFHERSIEMDFLLGMARLIQSNIRPELKIIVMSATLNKDSLAKHLGNCPIIASKGKIFPVREIYSPKPFGKSIEFHLRDCLDQYLETEKGDILVFLPGMAEIRRCKEAIKDFGNLETHILHGESSLEEQEKAIQPGKLRKIILSTNIAETSLTVSGVRLVIDSGLCKQNILDPNTGLNRLDTIPVSRSSAEQRKGRAGREGPGACIRFWTEKEQQTKQDFAIPEIFRVDLSETVLKLLALGESDFDNFPWIDPPSKSQIKDALFTLELLGATQNGKLTETGKMMATLPLAPRLGTILLKACELEISGLGSLAVAMLSEKSPFQSNKMCADFQNHIDCLAKWEASPQRNLSGTIMPERGYRILKIRDQLMRLVSTNKPQSENPDLLPACIIAGFPDRVIKVRDSDNSKGIMVGGKGIQILSKTKSKAGSLLIGLEILHGDKEAKAKLTLSTDMTSLNKSLISTKKIVKFDKETEKLVATQSSIYLDLVLEEKPCLLEETNLDGIALLEGIRNMPESRILPAKESAAGQWVERMTFLNHFCPELEIPLWTKEDLLNELPGICIGKKSLREVVEADWPGIIQSKLSYQQKTIISKEAPDSITLPNGKKCKLVYDGFKQPFMEARIQELFGWKESPKLARGRSTPLISLLAPNYRSQQLTSDLAGFWKTTYSQVRKDLRGRYPKHKWPEDPLNEKGGT